jgi:hypothetical protein
MERDGSGRQSRYCHDMNQRLIEVLTRTLAIRQPRAEVTTTRRRQRIGAQDLGDPGSREASCDIGTCESTSPCKGDETHNTSSVYTSVSREYFINVV